ncbi:MAG: ACT domain-containing protein [Chloroflexi bacterium]|nr:ACT domain-containing protein [Chloroflexota bacterium]
MFGVVARDAYERLPFMPLGMFCEDEGITVIATQAQADTAGLAYAGQWACITLTIHSSLTAVGFIAAISAPLAAAGLSINPVSAYYHDHLFVPWEVRKRAVQVLHEIAAQPYRR